MANETLIDSVEDKRTLKDIVDPYLPRKKHILPAIEALTGIMAAGERGRDPTLLDLAFSAPLAGGALRGATGIYQAWAAAVRKAGFSNADSAILTASEVLQSKTPKDFVKWLRDYSNQLFGSRIQVPKYKSGGKAGRRGRALTPQRAEDVRTANRADKVTDILKDPGRGKRPKGMYDD